MVPAKLLTVIGAARVKLNFPKRRITTSQQKDVTMSAKEPANAKPGRTPDSAYSFSFAIAIGLILFIAGLVISLTLGDGAQVLGLIFGIPLLLAGSGGAAYHDARSLQTE